VTVRSRGPATQPALAGTGLTGGCAYRAGVPAPGARRARERPAARVVDPAPRWRLRPTCWTPGRGCPGRGAAARSRVLIWPPAGAPGGSPAGPRAWIGPRNRDQTADQARCTGSPRRLFPTGTRCEVQVVSAGPDSPFRTGSGPPFG